MNILPVVLSSILILACVSTVFFRERKATIWEEKCYRGFMKAERIARGKIASAHYKKTKSKTDFDNKKPPSEHTPDPTCVNRKNRKELTEFSKLNIAPLFIHKSPALYEIAAGLLRELYGKTPFYKPKLEYLILDSMIATAQSDKKSLYIKDFFPEDPALRPIFYKIAKGTHGSYPPLGKYLTIDRNQEKKPIQFSYASIPLLVATFGKSATNLILAEEKNKEEKDNKNHSLTDNELKEILERSREKLFDYAKIHEFLDFSKKSLPQIHVTGIDESTHISITKDL